METPAIKVSATIARKKRLIFGILRKRERKHIRPGRDRDVLVAVDAVAHRRRSDQIAGVEMPERFARTGIERSHLPLMFSGKQDPAGRRQYSGPVVERAHLFVIP